MEKEKKINIKDLGRILLLMGLSFIFYGFAQSSLVIPKDAHDIVLQSIGAGLLCLVVIAILEGFYHLKKDQSPWGLGQKKLGFKDFVIIIAGFLVMMTLQMISVSIAGNSTSENQSELNKLTMMSTPLINVMFCVLAPICEEIIFRGLFFKLFKGASEELWVKMSGALLSGLLFALAHDTQFDRFFPIYWLMGSLLAAIYLYSKNINDVMIVHSATNAVPLIVMALI